MMKFIILLVLMTSAWAQTGPVDNLSAAVINAAAFLPSDVATSKKISTAEDMIANKSCIQEESKKCEDFAEKIMPKSALIHKNDKLKGKVDLGWKTVLEVKYMDVNERKFSNSSRGTFQPFDFSGYYTTNGQNRLETASEFQAEVDKLRTWFPNATSHQLKSQLFIDQLENVYRDTGLQAGQKDKLAFDLMAEYSKTMNNAEYLKFMSSIAGFVDYNDDRAAFIQKSGAGRGVVNTLELLIGQSLGVCGDIHGAATKLAEQKGWEAITVGYALEGMQHVVTAVYVPEDPTLPPGPDNKPKMVVVNYGLYEETPFNNTNSSILPVPSGPGGMAEIGTQLRIFKNKTPGADGKMQQIGTIKNAIGSFMSDLANKQHHIQKASPEDRNYRKEQVTFEHDKHKIKVKDDGEKFKDKFISEDYMIYEGEADNAKIFGVAVSRETFTNMYVWDEETKTCVPKRNKYFQYTVGANLMDLTNAEFDNTFFAYVNIKGGTAIPLIQSPHFQFGGILGYELDGFVSTYEDGFLSGDGHLATFAGVVAEYNKKSTTIKGSITIEGMASLRDQRLMNDLGTIPKNVNMFGYNAMMMNLGLTQQLGPKTTLQVDALTRISRIGGSVFLSTAIIKGKSTFGTSYQSSVRPPQIGNSLKNINFYQNREGPDGFKLFWNQGFGNEYSKARGTVSTFVNYNPKTSTPNVGVTGALTIGGRKKPAPRVP